MDNKKWYTIKVQTNYEKKVLERINIENTRSSVKLIDEVLIPTEKKFFVKNGKKCHKETILYPGYIFALSDHPSELAHSLKNVQGTSGLLKDKSGVFQFLKQSEVDKMMGDVAKAKEEVEITDYFIVGEKVKVNSGPFGDFNGDIEELQVDKQKVKVGILIFGRKTIVDLDLNQIDKIVNV